MSVRIPLYLPDDHWRSRWLVTPAWNRLHRVSDDIVWQGDTADDMSQGIGHTVCGKQGFLTMPDIFSRMGLPRCAHCCRISGVPRGNGAPFNEGVGD